MLSDQSSAQDNVTKTTTQVPFSVWTRLRDMKEAKKSKPTHHHHLIRGSQNK